MFVGAALCKWLDSHQGCISGVDARLARMDIAAMEESAFAALEHSDVMVLECASLSRASVTRIKGLHDDALAKRIIVVYQFGNTQWLQDLQATGIGAMAFPPDAGKLAFEIARNIAESEISAGESDLGELMTAKPRQFGAVELAAAAALESTLDCECPKHIAQLITALIAFEEYSASCSVDNWHEAAVHSCIYAYAGQARHLMEKALRTVLE